MAAGETLEVRPKDGRRWDLVSLGEVMLRLDPGDGRIATARSFQVWPGGAEYNVACALARCFGRDAAIVTALVDNPVGRLIEELLGAGRVDASQIRWVEHDGVGRSARNGLYFAERGFGARGGLACYDRGHTAVAQLQPGGIDWDALFGAHGARWFHTGGVFCGLSETAPHVAREAMAAARQHGAIVSYDVNYRAALWQDRGGKAGAQEIDRQLAPLVDVMLGVDDVDAPLPPGVKVVATTLRRVRSATRNDWGAVCRAGERRYEAPMREDLEVLDRIGGGDAFAAGLIYGFLAGKGAQYAVDCGAALGALTMTTPGDTTMATLADVESLMRGGGAGMVR